MRSDSFRIEFEVSHPSRKNKDAARVGHPTFMASKEGMACR
jgi:hypothetical protein